MSEIDSPHIEGIAEICRRMGAPAQQADVMARQLWKRSLQIADERGIKQAEALDHLLRVMISGREGVNGEDSASPLA